LTALAGAPLLGAVAWGTGTGGGPVPVALFVLLGWCVAAAVLSAEVVVLRSRRLDTRALVERLVAVVPRAVVSSSISLAPVAAAWLLFVLAGDVQPLIALLLGMLLLAAAPMVLAAGAL